MSRKPTHILRGMENLPDISHEDANALLSAMPTPDKVSALQAHLLRCPQVDVGTKHFAHGGMSIRTVLMPKGTIIVGALLNLDNVCIMQGDCTVTTDEGVKRFTGYHVIPAMKGFKRALVIHEDTHWTTVHRTDLTDLDAIEKEMTNESALLPQRNQLIENGGE